MTGIWKLVAYGIVIYASLAIFVYFMQSRLIFYPNMPSRDLITTPNNIDLAYDDVEFVTADNIKLSGWYIPHQQAKGTILFFHGNAGNISHRLESIRIFNRLQLNVFIIDYRGYGQSEGRVTEKGTYLDAEAAWNYLIKTKGIDAKEIIIFGRSLGASIATWLARKHSPAGLIIESGFTSVASMGQRIYPLLPIRWLTHYKYNTKEYIKNISCPVLVAHSKNDDIIPYVEGKEIFDAAAEPKTLLIMQGGHNDGFYVSGESYIEGLNTFISESLQ